MVKGVHDGLTVLPFARRRPEDPCGNATGSGSSETLRSTAAQDSSLSRLPARCLVADDMISGPDGTIPPDLRAMPPFISQKAARGSPDHFF